MVFALGIDPLLLSANGLEVASITLMTVKV